MPIFEKVVTILVIITVVLIGGSVTAFSVAESFYNVKIRQSGTPDEVIQSQLSINDWVDGRRAALEGRAAPPPVIRLDSIADRLAELRARRARNGGKAGPLTRKEVAANIKGKGFDNYVNTEGRPIPPDESVPGIPWVRLQEGVDVYVQPKRVPQVLYDKLQHFPDAYEEAQQGGGEFEETEFGPAYRINWVNPKSYLGKVAGLEGKDRIISVNGRPVGNSFTAGQQLFEELKNETKFAVKVLRGGKVTMLSFSIN